MNFELLKELLTISMTVSVISTLLIQKIKESSILDKNIKSSYLVMISFYVSMFLGTCFSLTFGKTNFIEALWVGLFTFIGADSIYLMLEDKVFVSLKSIRKSDKK